MCGITCDIRALKINRAESKLNSLTSSVFGGANI